MDLGAQDKKPIPRFSSFKPPAAPETNRPAERQSRESSRRDESTRRSRHRSHRDRSRSSDHHRGHREHRRSRKDEVQHEAVALPERSESKIEGADENETDLFVVDRKGDRHNITYGTLHRYSVPAFYRIGRGSVLGLPRRYKIDRSTAYDGKLVLRTDAVDAGPKPKSAFNKLKKQRPKLLRVRQEYISDAAVDAAADFLPLAPSKSHRSGKAPGNLDSEDERYAYRSIQGKAKLQDEIPSDLESAPESDSSNDETRRVELGDEVKQKNVELSRNAENNSYDVDAWLKLIDHQDAVLRGGGNETRPLTYAEKTSLADIKISLCEKALKRIGQSASKDRLLLRLLEEGAKLWDTKKLSSQWQTTLKSNSQFISLWVRYLDFRQTQFLDFTYERCMATFIDCLRLNMSSPDGPEKVNIQLYLFLRLTLFIREAGFTEHAVGLWQAVLESTFFRPDGLNHSDRDGVLSAFREFWESEVARIGDVGARGWKSGNSPSLEPKVSAFESQLAPRSIFPSWTACERERIMEAQTPARCLDESNDNDPYRVVISSDFEDFLPLIWGSSSPSGLINSFLYFCQLLPLTSPTNVETSGRWAGDNFLRNEFMSTSNTIDDWLLRPESDKPESSATSFPQHNFVHTLDTFFGDQHSWFDSLRRWTQSTSAGQSGIDPAWARRSLGLLVEANPENDDLAEYALALESAANSKEAKKYAKSLLKTRSSSLRLYNAYALIECRAGNHSSAEHVWATSVSLSKTFGEDDRLDVVLLWRAWIWESLEGRNLARASYLLRSMPQNGIDPASLPSASAQVTFSATELLKIRSFLSEYSERALAGQKPNVFVACTDILAIFLYVSHSSDLNNGLEAYATSMDRLSKTVATESFKFFTAQLLHQARARLVYHHVRTSSLYKPSQVRATLKESISAFPHNTIFLSLFAWNELRFRIEERVRDITRDITTTRSTAASISTTQSVPITSYLFSIYTELNRPVYAGSTLHSVRAAFEKAIGDSNPRNTATTDGSTARSNLSIWKLYILFELSHKEMKRAKIVFYRGVRACPWSKELIMLAFTHLRADLHDDPGMKRAGMGLEELHRVYNVLVEKELRVHVDIEDLLEEIAAKRAQHSATTTSSGMPIHMPDDADSGEEL